MPKKTASRKAKQAYIPVEHIAHSIYLVRGRKVMLDSDLAAMYGVETRRLNEQVKRNMARFPESFMFQLTKDEFDDLKSQKAMSSWGGRRKRPYVFTEHGALMAASVVNTAQAIAVSIQVIEAFVQLRKTIASNASLARKIAELSKKVDMHDKEITVLFAELQELAAIPEKKGKIGFKTPKKK